MSVRKDKIEREYCFCPYCAAEIAEAPLSYCQACELKVFFCPQCQKPMKRKTGVCPNCGAEIKG